jgi:hypothetical protein
MKSFIPILFDIPEAHSAFNKLVRKYLRENKYNAWGKENLTKEERKGKTYNEIQELRKLKWEAKQSNKCMQEESK